MKLECPHCGWAYDPDAEARRRPGTDPKTAVPYHDEVPPFRAVCPGSCRPPLDAPELPDTRV